MNMRRRFIICASLLAAILIAMSTAAYARGDNAVLQWNSSMLQAIRNTNMPPMRTARALAIVHTCIYDAWAAFDSMAVGTRLGDTLRRPATERTLRAKQMAISFAAYRALVDLFPSQKSVLFDPLMTSLGYNASDGSTDITTPSGIGNAACEAVLEFRHHDGSNQLGDEPGGNGPYSDYTGYTPLNSTTALTHPDHWQPLPGQTFAAPHWGHVIPFALLAADQVRPGAPALYGSKEYEHQAREIVQMSEKLDDRRKAIALYWADGPNTETPPGHWNLFAQFVSRRDGHTLDQDVKMFFALGNALLDVSIAVWDCKIFYDYVRPVSAVRFLYASRVIDAWAGPGRGTQAIPGTSFQSYIPTPPFAEYTSGHSGFSAAAAKVLELFTGSHKLGASFTVPAGWSFVEPGVAPTQDVKLSWATFEDAANQAGVSRRYGGIHFKDGDLASRKMGRRIGALVMRKAETFFNGSAPTP